VSKKSKLLEKLCAKPKDFTWDEASSLLKSCGYKLRNGAGSRRMFIHPTTHLKIGLHEPHPQNTLLPYMIDLLIEGLKAAGEL
jgi:hypothetical protein